MKNKISFQNRRELILQLLQVVNSQSEFDYLNSELALLDGLIDYFGEHCSFQVAFSPLNSFPIYTDVRGLN